MNGWNEAVVGALAGAIVTVATALLGRESVGRWLLAGQVRETTALQTVTELVKEAVTGWRESTMAYIQLASSVSGLTRDETYHYQDLRDRLVTQGEKLDSISERVTSLISVLANDG